MIVGQTITVDGDTWRVVAVGRSEGSSTYVHLASTTRGQQQRNGFRPAQVAGWLSADNARLTDSPEV